MGTPPSNAGGSHVIVPQSSPTDVHLTFSGGLGTSGEAGYSWKWKKTKDKTDREIINGMALRECEEMGFLGSTENVQFAMSRC